MLAAVCAMVFDPFRAFGEKNPFKEDACAILMDVSFSFALTHSYTHHKDSSSREFKCVEITLVVSLSH